MAQFPLLSQAQVRQLAHLGSQKKVREEYGTCIVEGWKGVSEALNSPWEVVRVVVTRQWLRSNQAVAEYLPEATFLVNEEEMDRMSQLATAPGILAEVAFQYAALEGVATGEPLLLCDGVNDPGNLGTIIRTADWFGVKAVLVTPGTVEPCNPKVVQASMGSLFHLNISLVAEVGQTVSHLKSAGYALVVTGPRGTSEPITGQSPLCIVVGSESHGIQPELMALADIRYSIPGSGSAESLNASVATGIALFDLLAKR